MRLTLIFVVAMTALMLPTNAEKPLPKEIASALNSLVDEFIDCGIYYSMAREGLFRRKKTATTELERYEKVSKQMFRFAANSGREIGLTEAGLHARVSLSKQRQLGLISGNRANFSVLIERFHKSCDELGLDPGDRLRALTLEANPKLKKIR